MSQIQEVKAASDIVQLLGSRLSLQRAGTQWKAPCPFHNEKTPSFFINEQFQRYKCFGCGESGDVFTFLEKYEGMTFPEALKYLADQAGITLQTVVPDAADQQRETMLAILDLAKEYYHYVLTEHKAGQAARDYLSQRGTNNQSVKIFQLGYALPAWDGLVQYLHHKKKFDLDDIVATGLAIKHSSGRVYDRFRDRVMFPLKNHRGQVVGFSGRVIDAAIKEAKYINTPETSLYHKGQMLYGYIELFQSLRQHKTAVVVEGEFDVISSAQVEVNHVVAIKGSALTPDHLKLLRRVVDQVVLALDTDAAGVEATKRAISLSQDSGLDVRVAVLPHGKDPDELARNNPKAWREATQHSVSTYDFLLQASLKAHDSTTAEGKTAIMRELGPIWAAIPLAVEQAVYIKKLAEALQTKEELVKQDVQRLANGTQRSFGPRRPTVPLKSVPGATPASTAKPKALTRQEKLERWALFLALRTTDSLIKPHLKTLESLPELNAQWLSLLQPLASAKFSTVTELTALLNQDQQTQLFEVYVYPEFLESFRPDEWQSEWETTLAELQKLGWQRRVKALTQQLEHLEAQEPQTSDQEQQYQQLLEELSTAQKQLHILKK
jgi:DNA primase